MPIHEYIQTSTYILICQTYHKKITKNFTLLRSKLKGWNSSSVKSAPLVKILLTSWAKNIHKDGYLCTIRKNNTLQGLKSFLTFSWTFYSIICRRCLSRKTNKITDRQSSKMFLCSIFKKVRKFSYQKRFKLRVTLTNAYNNHTIFAAASCTMCFALSCSPLYQ